MQTPFMMIPEVKLILFNITPDTYKVMKATILLFLLICSVQLLEYSQKLSGKMALLSTAIYNITRADQEGNLCRDCYKGFSVAKQVLGNKVLAMVGVDRKLRSIIVVFRGTSNIENMLTDLQFHMAPFQKDPQRCKKCKVHYGFYKSYQQLATEDVEQSIRKLFKKNADYGVIFTGHSLGGALANLAAADFKNRFPSIPLQIYTFGQPRVGNKQYADYLNRQLENYFRVIHRNDLITHVPPKINLYHHSGLEVWYKYGMNSEYFSCKTPSNCADQVSNFDLALNLEDHKGKYYVLLASKAQPNSLPFAEPTDLFDGHDDL